MKLALFLTQGTSIQMWDERGWLRGGAPVKAYKRWAEVFDPLYLVTYGGKEELAYQKELPSSIVILPKRWAIPNLVYSFFVPFLYWRTFKTVDLFYSAQMQGAWAAALSKWLFRKSFVLHCGFMWSLGEVGRFAFIKHPVIFFLEWLTCRATDFIIVTSDHAQRYLMERYGVRASKITVTRNPVDTHLFKPHPNIKRRAKSLIYVGRLEPEKNPMAILEAMVGLDFSLTLVGNGSLKPALQCFAQQHQLSVTFRGNVHNEQLPKLLADHEIFVTPSHYEGSPKALLEAMATGIPVIGTRVRGIQEIIEHGHNGYLCEPTAASLRESLVAVHSNPELRSKISLHARDFIHEHCQLEKKIQKELAIFESAVRCRRA